MDAHLRKFSSQSGITSSSDAQAVESLPSQRNGQPGGSPDHNGNDTIAQEGLLGIIMDVCKLHVNDAIHDFQRPAGPFRTSTFGKISFMERKPSYLDLDSDDEDEYEGPGTSTSHSPLSGADFGDKLRPLPLRVDSRSKSKDLNDQWADEKEQTRTHLTEIIRSHISRHIYLIRLCRALMLYGAPTHRLEE